MGETSIQPRPAARERILEAAARLFLRDGFRAVGYLERSNEQFWAWLEGATAGVDDPRAKLAATFEAVGKLANSPHCLGCTFQGTAAEFPDPAHPGHRVAIAHKQAVLARLRGLAQDAGLRAPEELAEQLLLLMDGAWVAARMFGPGNPSVEVAAAARTLVQAHQR